MSTNVLYLKTSPTPLAETMLVAVEKVAPTISLASGMDERTADFSPGSKDVLAYIAGNLEKLLIMTDDETKSCGKVEEWLPEAALLYGESDEGRG
jgi:hypothetical protein